MKSVQKLSYILYRAGVLNTAKDFSLKKKNYFVFVVVVGNNTSEHRANTRLI